jgi:hypothetical protein
MKSINFLLLTLLFFIGPITGISSADRRSIMPLPGVIPSRAPVPRKVPVCCGLLKRTNKEFALDIATIKRVIEARLDNKSRRASMFYEPC